jgi:hypothetical protein
MPGYLQNKLKHCASGHPRSRRVYGSSAGWRASRHSQHISSIKVFKVLHCCSMAIFSIPPSSFPTMVCGVQVSQTMGKGRCLC